jgi:hypothetical protein
VVGSVVARVVNQLALKFAVSAFQVYPVLELRLRRDVERQEEKNGTCGTRSAPVGFGIANRGAAGTLVSGNRPSIGTT